MDNLDISPESTFRTLLLMKMDYQHTEQVPFMQNDQRRVRGTTLFLAELFVQLKREDVSLMGHSNWNDISNNILKYFRI